MDDHKDSPLEVLKKHQDLNPKVVVMLSLGEDNTLTLDISHPVEMGTLAVMAKFSQLHLDILLKDRMGLK